MNLVERLLAHPEDRLALIAGDQRLTYGQLAETAARWRGHLAARGVGVGDRIAVVINNDEAFVFAHLAIVGLGAAIVPLNPASPIGELDRELAVVDPVVVIAPPSQRLGAHRSPLWADELETGEPHGVVDVEPDTPAALLFTSGTAGMPKPAVLSHGNLDASLRSVDALGLNLRASDNVVAAVVPLFHVFGLNAMVNLGLDIGATLVIAEYRGPEVLADLVATERATILGGPPPLWQALVASPSVTDEQFATVSLPLSGAAKLPPSTRLAARDRLGIDIQEGYGLTETCAIVATTVGTSASVGSVGPLMPGVEARLIDEDGADVLVGDPGELLVRGPMITAGYLDGSSVGTESNDSETQLDRATDADGWLHTGDVAVVDDDGTLSIVDRLKDLVIVSGFNVYPGEVETVLNGHPDVAQAAVVGEASAATGESLVAFVEPTPTAATNADGGATDGLIDDLRAHCQSELARYKVPKRFEIRDELPIGLGGKLRRRELR